MSFGDSLFIDGFCEGFLMAQIKTIIKAIDSKNKELKEIGKEAKNNMFAFITDEMLNELRTILSLKDEDIRNKKEISFYKKYFTYFENSKAFEVAKEEAIIALERKKKIEEIEDILDELVYLSNKYTKNKKGNIELLLKCSHTEIKTNLNTTAQRIKEKEKFLTNKNLKIITDITKKDLAKEIFKEFNDKFKIYKYKELFLNIKDEKIYEIFRIEKVDTTKSWIIEEMYGEEIISYIKKDKFNRILT